jgi:hypothetical protein
MWRSMGSSRFAAVMALVLVLLSSAFAADSIMAQDSDIPTGTPTSIPTGTPVPTATATTPPTVTPMPTATATTPPTQTPMPSATPTNLPTSTPMPTHTATQVPTTAPVVAATATPIPATQTPAATATGVTLPTSASIAPLVVTQNEPSQVTSGQSGSLSIIGANFTESTTVRLIGYGFLQTTFINAGSLTAALPSSVPTGTYLIEVSDPIHGTAMAPTILSVVSPPVTATPVPTATEVPGQPSLIVRSFSAAPSSIYPGDTAQIALELVNVGSRTATGVVVSLGDSKFSPANGQASVTVSDLAPYASCVVTLSVIAPADATEGPASIPLVLNSRDSGGTAYKDSATVSVSILAKQSRSAQIVLKSYTVTPSAAAPGETVTVQAVLANAGNQTASQVLLQLNDTSAVLVAGSQGNSFSVGTLKAGGKVTIKMQLVVANDAKSGIQAQAFTISYLQEGESKQTTASISLDVKAKESLAPQVMLERYTVTPNAAAPGEAVTVQAVLTNAGNETASQVLLQLSDTSAVLIAGSSGNSFPVGDMQPKASKTITLPLIVANDAKSGVQSQAFTISYLQEDESKQTTASISLEIKPSVEDSPVLLLKSYSTGQDSTLQPGQQFTYQMSIQNAGKQKVSSLLVIFGTVKSDSSSATATSSTTTSTNFAPLGSGDTVFVGDLPAGRAATVSQDFIVNSSLDSGVYSLPITLQYQLTDGTTTQQSLNASLIVVVQARLRASITSTLPDKLTVGETYSLTIKIANLGSSKVAVSRMHVTGDNITVTKGADALLDPLASEDNTTESVTIQAKAAGAYKITVEIEYTDDLNRAQTYTTTFTGEVVAPATPSNQGPLPPTPQPPQDLVGRLLLGLLGLGG